MSFLSALRRRPTASLNAWYRAGPCRSLTSSSSVSSDKSASKPSTPSAPVSSCGEGTVLEGLNWLKGQAPVTALADDQYPPWLWKLLEPKVIPDDGPGGKGEKIRLRKENRKRIRDTQFMKTQ
ncbi:hypothetical protein EIP91_004174 [Steccherinum ochraceum]|uniref:Large ribosomal subunit protein mL54 n=1 Tax=Steccherinum ochraceum TaxID=92696 RepID=A0A4R0RSJ4_9APHY|nr:hypothetical protein EIP91_004174 [Steccherinum ochraceum]